MKIDEVLKQFEIYTTNEERALLKKIDQVMPIESFTAHEQVVIENLIRKSLVSKVKQQHSYMVTKNDN